MTEDLFIRIRRTANAHRAQALYPSEVRITSERRRDLLRQCNLPEDTPPDGRESVLGLPLVLDDLLPADPGFAVVTLKRRP